MKYFFWILCNNIKILVKEKINIFNNMFLIFDRNKNIICLFLIMKYFEMLFQIV